MSGLVLKKTNTRPFLKTTEKESGALIQSLEIPLQNMVDYCGRS